MGTTPHTALQGILATQQSFLVRDVSEDDSVSPPACSVPGCLRCGSWCTTSCSLPWDCDCRGCLWRTGVHGRVWWGTGQGLVVREQQHLHQDQGQGHPRHLQDRGQAEGLGRSMLDENDFGWSSFNFFLLLLLIFSKGQIVSVWYYNVYVTLCITPA